MLNFRPKKIAPAKDGQRNNQRTSLPIQVKKVASPGMFLLQKKHGAENHTPEWKRRLEHLCCQRYGDLGKSIKLGAYYTVAAPVRPEITIPGTVENMAAVYAGDSSQIQVAEKLHISELIAADAKTRKMLEDRPGMYELCMNNISEGSVIELQKKEASYEAYDASKDFILMLADVWSTHMLAASGCP